MSHSDNPPVATAIPWRNPLNAHCRLLNMYPVPNLEYGDHVVVASEVAMSSVCLSPHPSPSLWEFGACAGTQQKDPKTNEAD
mmetsp:Transcript_43327/g.77858  ORF Transcript_43327/g.77858 Transcript_43327/m.77858 type:complete len:82 (-) Transcript_43327:360-605(-)